MNQGRRTRAGIGLAFWLVAGCSGERGGPLAEAGVTDPPDPPELAVPEPFAATRCAVLPEPAAGSVCRIRAGNERILLRGDVLTPGRVFLGGGVLVGTDGALACVGCDCTDPQATVIDCAGASISPGLINPHEHLDFVNHEPTPATAERYEQRHDWRVGLRGHTAVPTRPRATGPQLRWGELRYLLGGTTALAGLGRDPIPGLVRNLDGVDGLGEDRVYYNTFPLGDAGGIQRAGDCDYGADGSRLDTGEKVAFAGQAYLPHVAEGVDTETRNEFLCLSSLSYDPVPSGPPTPPDPTLPGMSRQMLLEQSAFIHGVGLTAADYAAMAEAGTALIWSPRSNLSLYGITADVVTADRLGVQIALGTDWILSGSMNTGRELACADHYNRVHLDNYFTAEQLWRMVTLDAAAVTGTDDLLGVLKPGALADIAVFRGRPESSPYRTVVSARPEDAVLVMRGGRVLVAEPPVAATLGLACETLDICGAERAVCVADELGQSLSALRDSMASLYPLFFCGIPRDEPSCQPARTTGVGGSTVFTGVPTSQDLDGDGLGNPADNCPRRFNPVRPLDAGRQADADQDGVGDSCDTTPLG